MSLLVILEIQVVTGKSRPLPPMGEPIISPFIFFIRAPCFFIHLLLINFLRGGLLNHMPPRSVAKVIFSYCSPVVSPFFLKQACYTFRLSSSCCLTVNRCVVGRLHFLLTMSYVKNSLASSWSYQSIQAWGLQSSPLLLPLRLGRMLSMLFSQWSREVSCEL